MPYSYKQTPISGFTGYIPGAKWQVGSKFVPQQNYYSNGLEESRGNLTRSSNQDEPISTIPNQSSSSATRKGDMTNYAGMSREELRDKIIELETNMQNLKSILSSQADSSEDRYISTKPNNSNALSKNNDQRRTMEHDGDVNSMKQRSKSLPKRVENNPFDGIESGWWSKGEVQRNKERRVMADNGKFSKKNGNWNSEEMIGSQSINSINNFSREDIPAAGYSGHIQGLRHMSVGKPFNVAAKEAKKEYLERRKHYNESKELLNTRRGVQYSDEEILSTTMKLPSRPF